MTVTLYNFELIFGPLLALAGFLFAFGCMRAIEEFIKYIDRKMDLQTKDSIIKALESQRDCMVQDYERAINDCARYETKIEHALRIARRNNQIDIVVILEEALK